MLPMWSRCAIAVGDGHVVSGVKQEQAHRVIDDPHVDGDHDVVVLVFRIGGQQNANGQGAEQAAGGPENLGTGGAVTHGGDRRGADTHHDKDCHSDCELLHYLSPYR
jgi:hypothetical protein